MLSQSDVETADLDLHGLIEGLNDKAETISVQRQPARLEGEGSTIRVEARDFHVSRAKKKKLARSIELVALEGATADHRVEQLLLASEIAGGELEDVANSSARRSGEVREATGEQDALERIEPSIAPRLEVVVKVLVDEVAIEKRLVMFARQVAGDDLVKEVTVFEMEEQVELVTGVFAVQTPALVAVDLERKRIEPVENRAIHIHLVGGRRASLGA